MKRMTGGLKRAAALLMSLFMILSQFAFPVTALAQETSMLPGLNLTYAMGESTQTVFVQPVLYQQQPVYWATLPAETLQSGVTLEIVPTGAEGESYQSAYGYQLMAQDASAVDGTMAATYIEVYRNDMLAGSYPLYLSTQLLPPEQQEPRFASITMKIVDSANRDSVFYSSTDEYGEGSHTFTPDSSYLPENYTLDSTDGVTVNVYADGTADLYEVVFTATYQQPQPRTASITMKIVDSANRDSIFYSSTDEYGEGSHTFTPDSSYLPENYTLDSTDSVTVNVYADGTADLYEVVFTATYQQPQEKTASITMKIVDSTNLANVLFSHTAEYGEGKHTFMPDAAVLPENYTLDTTDGETIEVYADGTAAAYEVVFTATWHDPNPAPDPDPDPQPDPDPEPDPQPDPDPEPDPQPDPEPDPEPDPQPGSDLPDGCTVISEINAMGKTTSGDLALRTGPGKKYNDHVVRVGKGVEVWVNRLLRNDADEEWYHITYKEETRYVMAAYVELVQENPQSHPVTFLYQDEQGHSLMDAYEETLAQGVHSTAPYQKGAPDGYVYAGVNAETVTVDENGATPDVVVFTYTPKAPVEVDFTLQYLCEGQPIIEPVIRTLGVGSYPVSDFVQAFEGYTFTGASQETLVVNEDGTSSATEVTLTYQKDVVQASVTIYLQDEKGNPIAQDTSVTL
ncbi:MAG: hypothetical protein PUD63_09510, partial [Clostridia bacterium]|nr:hypothetical protein [Clostridia bacterium]